MSTHKAATFVSVSVAAKVLRGWGAGQAHNPSPLQYS